MTQLQRVKIRLGILTADTTKDDLIEEYLLSAEADIMNKRFPFGLTKIVIDEDTGEETEVQRTLELQYYNLQVELAVVKYNEQGVEGQTDHSENGINRSYGNKLLDQVVPFCKAL
jgi:hypothetical protein